MSTKKSILIIAFFAVISGVFFSIKTFGHVPSLSDDGIYYSGIAKNIVERSSFVSGSNDLAGMSDPLYPLFVSGVYSIFGVENFDAVRIVQAVLFAATAVAIFFLVIESGFGSLAIWPSIFFSLFYPLAASVGQLHKEVLFTFLLVLTILFLYKAQKNFRLLYFFISGLLLGLSALTNTVAQFFIILVVCNFIFLSRKEIFSKKFLAGIVVLLASFVFVVFAWVFCISAAFGVPSNLNLKEGGVVSRKAEVIQKVGGEKYLRHLGGQVFGYYFFASDEVDPSDLMGHTLTQKKYTEMAQKGFTVEEINKTLLEDSRNVILKNIPKFFAVSILDFLQFNGPMLPGKNDLQSMPAQNLFIGGSYPSLPVTLKVVILLVIRLVLWAFFGLVFYGLIKSIKNWDKAGWLVIIIAYFNVVYSAIFGLPRYAIPVYPFYIIFFVLGASYVYERKQTFL